MSRADRCSKTDQAGRLGPGAKATIIMANQRSKECLKAEDFRVEAEQAAGSWQCFLVEATDRAGGSDGTYCRGAVDALQVGGWCGRHRLSVWQQLICIPCLGLAAPHTPPTTCRVCRSCWRPCALTS